MRRILLLGTAVLTLLTAACGGDDATDKTTASKAADKPAVTVKDFVFGPKTITVKSGTEITWTNEDEFDHSIQIDELDLQGPLFGPPAGMKTFTHTFEEAGTFSYLCGVHNSMTGTVVVTK